MHSSRLRLQLLALGDRVRVLAQEIECCRFFRRERGLHLLRLLLGDFGEELDIAIAFEAGARGNQPAHDDIFLQAAQVIDLSGNCRLGEDAGSLLEARGGDERIRRERSLGDAQEQRAPGCRPAAIVDDAVVLFAEAELVYLLFEEKRCVSDIFHFHPAHHLADDLFDVFVVDVHALEPVNLLNRVHEVGLRVFFAEDSENVVRVQRPVDQRLASPNAFAFLDVDVNTARNGIFLRGVCPRAALAFDVNLSLALDDFAVLHEAVDFADDRGIFRLARFEELNDARETAGDVFRFGGLAGDFCEHIARLHFVSIDDHQVRARGHEVFLGAPAGAADVNRGLMLFIAGRQRNDELRKTGDFVHLLFNGDAGLKVFELNGAGSFREDREGVRIPFAHGLTERDRLPVFDLEPCAVYDVVTLFFAALFVDDGDEAGAVHRDDCLAATLDDFEVDELDEAVVAGFDLRLFGDAGGSAADVERPHGELRAWFADGLSGDYTHRFAHLDEPAGGEVAAVATGANSTAGFARQHRADFYALDAGGLN